MTEFLSAISGWLSIAALILSIPLGIAANIATPKVQVWLAQISTNALRRRIISLHAELEFTDRLVSDTSFAIAVFAWRVVVVFVSFLAEIEITILCALIVVPEFANWIKTRSLPVQQKAMTLESILVGLLILAGVTTFVYFLNRPYFHLRNMLRHVALYKTWREDTLRTLQELEIRRTVRESKSVLPKP